MTLEVEYNDVDKKVAYDFCKWLLPQIQEYIYAGSDDRKLAAFDFYLNTNDIIQWQFQPQMIRTKNILIGASYNLIIKDYSDYYEISIDPNINIPNSYAKFIDIVSLIDKGNIDIPPYPIFTDAMEYFADNLQMYYDLYIEETSKAKETNGN